MLLIACGALAREIVALIEANRWRAFDVQCLPAIWHNTPSRIPEAVRRLIRDNKSRYRSIFVLYGTVAPVACSTRFWPRGSSALPAALLLVLDRHERFDKTAEEDLTTFFLTDYLVRHFDKLIWEGLGIAAHPELLLLYFGNYHEARLSCSRPAIRRLRRKRGEAAARLGLAYEYRFTGYGELGLALTARA